jgi:RHS repeat-associated protein
MGCPNLSVQDYFHFVEDEETDGNGFFFVGEDDYPSGSDGAKQTSYERPSPSTGENPLCGNFCGVSIDPDGNLTQNGRDTFVYDAENRMVSSTPIVPSVNSNKVEFKYDYMGRRVEKKVYSWSGTEWQLSKTEKFVYDGTVPLAVFDASNNLKESYLYGEDISGSLQATGGIGGLIAVKDASGTYLPCFDGSGNIVAYIDASNSAKVAEIEYGPDGRQIVKSGPKADDFRMRFSTLPYDSETNSTRFLYRDLLHDICRWSSREPLGERASFNLYGFVNNHSVNSIDRLGLEEQQLKPLTEEEFRNNQYGTAIALGGIDSEIGKKFLHRYIWQEGDYKLTQSDIKQITVIMLFSAPENKDLLAKIMDLKKRAQAQSVNYKGAVLAGAAQTGTLGRFTINADWCIKRTDPSDIALKKIKIIGTETWTDEYNFYSPDTFDVNKSASTIFNGLTGGLKEGDRSLSGELKTIAGSLIVGKAFKISTDNIPRDSVHSLTEEFYNEVKRNSPSKTSTINGIPANNNPLIPRN